MKTIILILIIVVIGFIMFGVHNSKKDEVYKWAKSKGYKISSIETNYTIIGSPFMYLQKGQWIFDVRLTTSNNIEEHWWVRTGVFTNDYEIEK